MATTYPFDLSAAVDAVRAAARAAAERALVHWRRLERVEKKSDGTPVTVADREAEDAAVAELEARFPGTPILGEEGGARGGDGPTRFVVDPLDGTIGYARGGVMWGPLVALEHEGEVVAGAMELPVLRAAYWAGRGLGCFRDGDRVRVSTTDLWRRAVVSLGGMKRVLFEHPRAAAIEGLVRSARSGRAYGDVGSCAMLLDGTADVWLEAGVRVWDLAAPRILVEEAGGRFTDFAGRPGHATGEAVASNGVLHDHVLAALSG